MPKPITVDEMKAASISHVFAVLIICLVFSILAFVLSHRDLYSSLNVALPDGHSPGIPHIFRLMLSVIIGVLIALMEYTSRLYGASIRDISVSKLLRGALAAGLLASLLVALTIISTALFALFCPSLTIEIDTALTVAFAAQAFVLGLTGQIPARRLLAGSPARAAAGPLVRQKLTEFLPKIIILGLSVLIVAVLKSLATFSIRLSLAP